ncbi:MAG: hypothetical protein IKG58_01510 [Bacilli bacterium]|nr:hypothetical protein [Bacilli bacterium]
MEKNKRLIDYNERIKQSTIRIKDLFRTNNYDNIINILESLDKDSIEMEDILDNIDHESDEYKEYIDLRENFNNMITSNIGKKFLEEGNYKEYIDRIKVLKEGKNIDKDILPRTKEETKPHKFFGKIIDTFKAFRKLNELMGFSMARHFREEPYKEDLIERLMPIAYGISDKTYEEAMKEHTEYVRSQREKNNELKEMFNKQDDTNEKENTIGSK